MDRGLRVPPIYSPFPSAIHPRHIAINKRTAAWAEAFIGSDELCGKLVKQDIGTFAARILPEGREEVISVLADFIIWLFGVDDGHCEEGELGERPGELAGTLSRMLRIAQNPEVPMLVNDPLANGLRDLHHRIAEHGTAGQVARWVDALREYFLSVVWEAHHRSKGTIPDLNDYTLMRIYDGATSVVLPLLEMGQGYELHPSERDQKRVRAVAEMASFIITWDNDIFSYHKESRSSRYYLNALRVLEHEHGLAPVEALNTAIAQRDRVLCLFLNLVQDLHRHASPQLRQYLRSLGHFIRGSQDWGITSQRYTTPDDPAALPWDFHETPTDTSPLPLNIPAISWWWDAIPMDATAHGHHGQGAVNSLLLSQSA
jgi:selina-4(15),7(11)-diene synthase